MKKRIFTLFLGFSLTVSIASANFSDITDSNLQQTASVLNGLGIMQGVGNDKFDPDGILTRAQFCKLAVLSMGCTDVSEYEKYIIFPDVPKNSWAAPYINAAIRHPDLKQYPIIRGYADGTFGPNKTVNYGEACTMLLRMLGYEEADVGPFWPKDYINFASSLGITKGVSVSAATAQIKRSDAAIMLLNTLGTPTKDGNLLLDQLSSGSIQNCILLETSDSDTSLKKDEVLFFENGNVGMIRKTTATLDKAMIGTVGTVMLGSSNVVTGIAPTNDIITKKVIVSDINANEISAENFTVKPGYAPIYFNGYKKVVTYSDYWNLISKNQTITLYYDISGNLILIYA